MGRQAKVGPLAGVGVGKALKAGWISLEAGVYKPKATSIVDETSEQLKAVQANPEAPAVNGVAIKDAVLKDLKKRKLVNQMCGPVLAQARARPRAQITDDGHGRDPLGVSRGGRSRPAARRSCTRSARAPSLPRRLCRSRRTSRPR